MYISQFLTPSQIHWIWVSNIRLQQSPNLWIWLSYKLQGKNYLHDLSHGMNWLPAKQGYLLSKKMFVKWK